MIGWKDFNNIRVFKSLRLKQGATIQIEDAVGEATQVLGAKQAAEANTAAATAVAMPAGGTGAAAGGWDTAANRDQAIAEFAALLADVAALRTTVNSLLAKLRTHGIINT